MKRISRRDFLKVASVGGGALVAAASRVNVNSLRAQSDSPNIIVIVFDAMSASNLSLYGYPRDTSPNLEKFAQRATVYHSHYASGSFTTPGTASLMTGTYPWTHRAMNLFGLIERDIVKNNFFNVVGGQYERSAFSQNALPNYFMEQFPDDLDAILNPASFSFANYLYSSRLGKDRGMGYRVQDFLALEEPTVLSHSLLFGPFVNYMLEQKKAKVSKDLYPLGAPQVKNGAFLFTLSDLMNGMAETILSASRPFMHYFHVMAPHEPYRPDVHFFDRYDEDGLAFVKERANFDTGHKQKELDEDRRYYDAFIANLDHEFGQFLDVLEQNKVFENSYVIVTSDHGEMFERGVKGHLTRHLYEPGIRIPLLISKPGQRSREDVFSPTNNVDILPTLSYITHGTVPDWSEGKVLPGLGGVEDMQRSVFTVEAKSNSAFRPLTKATFAMRKGDYKLIYYTGYEFDDFFELYDIQNDPEEITNLYPSNPAVLKSLKDELLETIDGQNKRLLNKN